MVERFQLRVNGTSYEVDADPKTALLYVLRNHLNFKGVKDACGLEQCGACNVLIDGVAVPSCQISAGLVQHQDIVTIEGLGVPENLHPLQ